MRIRRRRRAVYFGNAKIRSDNDWWIENRFTRVVHDDDAAVCREEAARRALCKLRGEDVGDFRGNRSIEKKDKKDDNDVTIALTHQTLSEDDEYIRKVGEDKLDLILGGHEHQPFIGLVSDDGREQRRQEGRVVRQRDGPENVVVVTIKKVKEKGNNNNNTGKILSVVRVEEEAAAW